MSAVCESMSWPSFSLRLWNSKHKAKETQKVISMQAQPRHSPSTHSLSRQNHEYCRRREAADPDSVYRRETHLHIWMRC